MRFGSPRLSVGTETLRFVEADVLSTFLWSNMDGACGNSTDAAHCLRCTSVYHPTCRLDTRQPASICWYSGELNNRLAVRRLEYHVCLAGVFVL
jgi:hypothetical protein